MRISDWSSDVCSSDLFADALQRRGGGRAFEVLGIFPQRARHVCADQARRDAIDAHPLRPEFDREIARDLHVGGLRNAIGADDRRPRSEEHTSELQSLMRISYAVFCLKKQKPQAHKSNTTTHSPTTIN